MILALDSSTSHGSLALVRDGFAVREIAIETPRARGAALFTALEEILTEAGDLTRVVVGTGPGSYNGIRSALAAGWGISAARKVPLVGISSLLGLDEGAYCAIGDARRGQFYFAVVENGSFLKEPALLEREDFLKELGELPASLPILSPAPLDQVPSAQVRTPSAARLARIGASLQPETHVPEPIYLKPAYINTAVKAGR